ncbi:MAG: PEP-CTERM sorting domain-containing protein [Planctomycetaceae bacterium]
MNDVTNSGFSLDIVSFLSGISSIAQTSETGTAFANGAHFAVGVDDSTDAPDTYSNLTSLFNDTNGVTIVGNTSAISAVQNTETASLGSFVGTTTFSLRFTTVTTPTTNILFGNGRSGTGQIDYGLGNLGSILSIDPEDLGHFITITVSFDEIVAVPEPSSAILLTCSGIAFVFYRRRRT